MQDTNNGQNSPAILPESRGLWYVSIAFLLVVAVLSVGLYISTQYTERSIVSIQKEIAKIDISIQSINKDPNIVIAKIVQENTIRPSIALKSIVTQFRLAAIKANVTFDGFSIKNDTIITKLISTSGNTIHPDPVATIISMMNDYAKNEKKEFRLGKITNITGDVTKRTTTIELKVLSTPNK